MRSNTTVQKTGTFVRYDARIEFLNRCQKCDQPIKDAGVAAMDIAIMIDADGQRNPSIKVISIRHPKVCPPPAPIDARDTGEVSDDIAAEIAAGFKTRSS